MTDDELLGLFATEATEALELLADEAIGLERGGPHGERIASMFRAAHSLKGSARLVGLTDLGDVAHALEEVLSDLRAGTLAPSPALATLVLDATESLRTLLAGALDGADVRERSLAATRAIAEAAQRVRTGDDAAAPTDAPAAAGAAETAAAAEAAASIPPETPAPAATAAATDTVRVPAARLDLLGRLVGEALAAHVGLERALGDDGDERVAAAVHGLGRVLTALDDEARRARMVSFQSVAGPLQRAARDVARGAGKSVEWAIDGGDTQLDRHVLEGLRDPLLHLVRNAVDHGLESPDERAAAGKPPAGTVNVRASTRGEQIVVTVGDDGRGVDRAAVLDAARALGVDDDPERAIFSPGVSTAATVTDVSGRGVGLDVVRDAVHRLRGRVEMRSEPGAGTSFELTVPLSVASLRCLIVTLGAERYGLPVAACATIVDELRDRMRAVEGGQALEHEGRLIAVRDLRELLGGQGPPAAGPVVVLSVDGGMLGVRVDGFERQRDVVIKDLPRHAAAIPAIAGASVEPDGSVMLVLEPRGLAARRPGPVPRSQPAATGSASAGSAGTSPAARAARAEILVVDDALTVRELQRSVLRRAGYAVRTAVDGHDAVSELSHSRPDLVISDIEMPRMDGFALTESIRSHPGLANLPVILVTSLGDDEHRRRGLEAGADAYLAKDTFDEAALLEAIDRILGVPA